MGWFEFKIGVIRFTITPYELRASADQRLNVKNEDACLYLINEQYVLGLYISYYEGADKNKAFSSLLPAMLKNAKIRKL